jgi:hypothetical protein
MDVTFDFIASLVYGEKMKLELRWGVEKGVLTYTIQSGEPRAAAERMTSTYGSQAAYDFRSISDQQMHLVRTTDKDEGNVWTRVE